MKKLNILLIIGMLFGTLNVFAQIAPSKFWTAPSVFLTSEEVTIFVDVSGTDLDGNPGPLYFWTWNNGGPVDALSSDGEWGSDSTPEMEWTRVEGNVWSKTFIPDQFYAGPMGSTINGLLRTVNGGTQTSDFEIEILEASSLVSDILATHPAQFAHTDNVSILVNVAKAWSDGGAEQGQLVGGPVGAHTGYNSWNGVVEGGDAKSQLTDMGNNIWRLDMVPATFYETSDVITEINMLFNSSGDWAKSGRDAGGENFTIPIIPPGGEVKETFYAFPSTFTSSDVVSFYFTPELIDEGFKWVSGLAMTVKKDGADVNVDLKSEGNGVYSISMIPKTFFLDNDISDIEFTLKSADGTLVAEPISFSTESCQ